MGFQVNPDTLRAAAQQARLAGQSTQNASIRHLAQLVAAALPGAKSAKAVADFTDDWSARLSRWSQDTEEYGEKLGSCAAVYVGVDEQTVRNLTGECGTS